MSELRVTPESLHAAAGRLRAESARIESALLGLESEAGALRASWDGAAQVAYDNAQRRWSADFATMKNLLAQIATSTDSIGDSYTEVDQAAAKAFR